MKRRDFVKAAGVVAAVGAVPAPAIAQSAPTIRWRLQSSYPTSLETLYGAPALLSKMVSEATEGKFTIQVYPAGAIVPALSVFDGVQNGTVEMGHSGAYFYMGKNSALAFGTGVPFGPNSRQMNAWFYQAGGIDLLNEVFAPFKIFHLPAGNTGTQMGGWYRKEIKTVADLKGLKMRIGGLGGTVWQKLGVVPQQLSAADTYTALERGTIDAVEWVSPYDDEKIGFQKITKNYYFPGFWDGNAALSYFISLDKWNELPASYQSILKTAAMASATDMQAKYDALNPPAMRRLIAGGVRIRPFSSELLKASYVAAKEVYREMGEKNPAFKKIHDHMFAFRDLSYQYFQATDFAYDQVQLQAVRQKW